MYFIIAYIISVPLMWWITHKLFSKGGAMSHTAPGSHHILLMIIPIVNTILIVVLLASIIIDKVNNREFIDKFFKIK